MTLEVSENYMFLPTTWELCENLHQAFSMKQDITTCYELKIKILNIKQGALSITNYYEAVNGLWIELDQYQNLKMKCSKDTTKLAQFIEKDRIFKFLIGLNPKYDPIWVQMLGKEKLPSLSKMFYTVHGEEIHKAVTLDDKPTNRSAMATSKATQPSLPSSSPKSRH